MRLLSENSGTDEQAEKEAIAVAVRDLAEDFRDAILDYQVSTDTEKRPPDSLLMRLIVLAAESNLQPKLYLDCESQVPFFQKTSDVD